MTVFLLLNIFPEQEERVQLNLHRPNSVRENPITVQAVIKMQ